MVSDHLARTATQEVESFDALEAPSLTEDDLGVLALMQHCGAVIRENSDTTAVENAWQALAMLGRTPEARALFRKIGSQVDDWADQWEEAHPDARRLPAAPERVVEHVVQRTFVAAADYRPPIRCPERVSLSRPARSRPHRQSRRRRRKSLRATVGSSSGGRGDPDRPLDDELPRVRCGSCGKSFPPTVKQQGEITRGHDVYCGDLCRKAVRAQRARDRRAAEKERDCQAELARTGPCFKCCAPDAPDRGDGHAIFLCDDHYAPAAPAGAFAEAAAKRPTWVYESAPPPGVDIAALDRRLRLVVLAEPPHANGHTPPPRVELQRINRELAREAIAE